MKVVESAVKHTNPWTFALNIGFFAGLIWGAAKLVFSYFEFTNILPGFLVEPFFKHAFLRTFNGYLVGWAVFIVMSVVAAYLYTLFFRKLNGPWPGILYGLGWWAVLFVAAGPLAGLTKRVDKLGVNTFFTEVCLFLLWGLFIGYTISEEFTEERHSNKESA